MNQRGDRDQGDDEGKAVIAQRDDAGRDRRNFHEDPTAFDPHIEVLHRSRLAELAPEAKRVLDAIDRKGRHQIVNDVRQR
jgi:hypothetical protein